MLTQPSYLWALVRSVAELHRQTGQADSRQRGLPGSDRASRRPLDPLGRERPQLQVAGRNPDTFDLRQRGPEIRRPSRVPAVPGLPRSDRSLRARASELRPHRQLPDAGRGRTIRSTRSPPFFRPSPRSSSGPADPPSLPGSPLAPRTVTGAQGLATALISTGVFDGCAAQRMLGVAIGQWIKTYDTCELGPIRAAERRNDQVAFHQPAVAGFHAGARRRTQMISYKFARRSFLRGAGGPAPLMLPLLRSIEARAAGAAAPLRLLIIQHPLGTYPGLDELGPQRERDDDQLHASARERAVRAASEVHGHDRRPEPGRRRWRNAAPTAARTRPRGAWSR